MTKQTDAVLWYNVGVFGDEGYGVPNCSDDPGSLNPTILDLVALTGRNLSTVMHHEDVAMRTPPSINTIKRIHRLYVRAGQLLRGRAVPPGEDNFEMQHAQSGGDIFVVFPVPYFRVRNSQLRRWAGYMLACLSEMMQHTENRRTVEISQGFAGQIGQYFHRVYTEMAIELFGIEREIAYADGFLLTDEQLSGYDPSLFFTSTELIDTVPRLDRVFTEDELAPLTEGIPVTSLPPLQPWPTSVKALYQTLRGDDVNATDDAFAAPGTEEAAAGTGATTAGREQPTSIVPPAPSP